MPHDRNDSLVATLAMVPIDGGRRGIDRFVDAASQ
jgi:hypothetical protein